MKKLDLITSKKAQAELGISRAEMDEIKREMKKAGYHVVKDGRITWMKPSEIEQYLLYERGQG
jgi:hypothetical protein